MKALIKLRAINGYINPKRFEITVNENLTISLESTVNDCVFLLEWNGQVFKFDENKSTTILYEYIKQENTIVVRAGAKRFNCGKLFTRPIDAEMVEILDIELKYQQDIARLIGQINNLQAANRAEIKALDEKIIHLQKMIQGLLATTNALENGKFKLLSFKENN